MLAATFHQFKGSSPLNENDSIIYSPSSHPRYDFLFFSQTESELY